MFLFQRFSTLWRQDPRTPVQFLDDDDEWQSGAQSSRSMGFGRSLSSASNLETQSNNPSLSQSNSFFSDFRETVKRLPHRFTKSTSLRAENRNSRLSRNSRNSGYSDCASIVGSLPVFQPRKKKKKKRKGNSNDDTFLRRSSSIWSMHSSATSDADHDVVLQHEHRDEMKLMLRDDRIPFNYHEVFTNDDDEPRWTGLMIRALSPLSQIFNGAVIAISAITCFTSTLTFTYVGIDPTVAVGSMVALRLTLEICFAVLLALEFYTTHIDVAQGMEITDQHKVWHILAHRTQFWLDIWSFGGLFCFTNTSVAHHWLCLLPLLRAPHMTEKPIRYLLSTPPWFKLAKLAFSHLLLGHLVSCAWFLIVWQAESFGCHWNMMSDKTMTDVCELQENVLLLDGPPWYHLYGMSLVQGAYMILGLDRVAFSTAEHYYLSILAPLGAVVQAYIFGEVFLIVSRRQHLATQRHAEDAIIATSFRLLEAVPAIFQERTVAFFSYQRIHCSQQNSQEELLRPLTAQLRFELHLSLYAGLVGKTELFKTSKPTVVREIVSKLAEVVFLPGDYVCHKGERGDCMYFLVFGQCSVLCDISMLEPLLVLHAGEYFGEVSLLTGVRRTAYVRADMFSTLATLTKTALAPVLKKWPEEIDGIIRNVRTQDDREKVRQAAYRLYGIFFIDDCNSHFERSSSRASTVYSDAGGIRHTLVRNSVDNGQWRRRLSRARTDSSIMSHMGVLKRSSTSTLASIPGSSRKISFCARASMSSMGDESDAGEQRLCEKCGVTTQKIMDVYRCWCCGGHVRTDNDKEAQSQQGTPQRDNKRPWDLTLPQQGTPSRGDAPSQDLTPPRQGTPQRDNKRPWDLTPPQQGTPPRGDAQSRDLTPRGEGASPRGDTQSQDLTLLREGIPSRGETPPQGQTLLRDMRPPREVTPPQDMALPPDDASTPPRDVSPPQVQTPPRDVSPPQVQTPPRDVSPQQVQTPPRDVSPPQVQTPARDVSPPPVQTPPRDVSPPQVQAPSQQETSRREGEPTNATHNLLKTMNIRESELPTTNLSELSIQAMVKRSVLLDEAEQSRATVSRPSRRRISVGAPPSQKTMPRQETAVVRVGEWENLREDAQTIIDGVKRIVVSLENCELKIHLDCRENWKNCILQEIGEDLLGTCNNDLELISEMMCMFFPRINRKEIELSNVVI